MSLLLAASGYLSDTTVLNLMSLRNRRQILFLILVNSSKWINSTGRYGGSNCFFGSLKVFSVPKDFTSIKICFQILDPGREGYAFCTNENSVIRWRSETFLLPKEVGALFPMHPFSTPWKHQKTLTFSDVFRG